MLKYKSNPTNTAIHGNLGIIINLEFPKESAVVWDRVKYWVALWVHCDKDFSGLFISDLRICNTGVFWFCEIFFYEKM